MSQVSLGPNRIYHLDLKALKIKMVGVNYFLIVARSLGVTANVVSFSQIVC